LEDPWVAIVGVVSIASLVEVAIRSWGSFLALVEGVLPLDLQVDLPFGRVRVASCLDSFPYSFLDHLVFHLCLLRSLLFHHHATYFQLSSIA